MDSKYLRRFRDISAQAKGSTHANMFFQVSISRTGIDHLADRSFEMLDVAPEDATSPKFIGYSFVREAGMLGLILNKQDACTPSDQTRLRIFDLCVEKAAYYLCLRIHVIKIGSRRSIPEAGRILKPHVAFLFEEFDCFLVRPFIAKQFVISIDFFLTSPFHLIRYRLGQLVVCLQYSIDILQDGCKQLGFL